METNLPGCAGCGLPVLELRGQFTRLDSFLLEGDTALASSAGDWHLSCLAAANVGRGWRDARLANLRARGYDHVADVDGWSVVELRRTRDRLACSPDGVLLSLLFASDGRRSVPGGLACRVDVPEMSVELDAATRVQAALTSSGTYPLLAFADDLGMRARLSHAELLVDSALRHDAELAEEWTPRFVLARVVHDVFVPGALMPHLISRS
jgi:hypothetical protein